ncbi:MAG: chromate resistance protein [Afipia felis]|nr:chromate resistance protein [Afipia felis]
MSSYTSISVEKLVRLVGTVNAPSLFDIRTAEEYAVDPYLIPGAFHGTPASAATWAASLGGQKAVVVCQKGGRASEGVAATLRFGGFDAEILEGGFEEWRKAALPTVRAYRIPAYDEKGRTTWVTRSRPKIDRIACPWLIRRFIDPKAVFLFVTPSRVQGVAEEFGATPFDIDNVFWSHRGDLCTFDVLIDEFGIATPPLLRLAQMVRAADTARLDLSKEAPGLLAVSLGLSRMFDDDLQQLEAGLTVYDAFYRWCRDATDETHNWPAHKPTMQAAE